VTIAGAEIRGSRAADTDEQGRFAFASLPAGRYTLNASKPGHVGVSYGQRQPGAGRPGTPIQLADGQKFDTRLQLPRGGVITGTILDEHAEANPGTMVRVMRFVTQSGQRTLQQAGGGSTDDRGIYRVFGLQPGNYIVCATPRNTAATTADRQRVELDMLRRAAEEARSNDAARAQQLAERVAALQAQIKPDEPQAGYAPVCYPGTTASANAGPIALGVAEERTGVDFQLQLVPVGFVEGMVTGPAGTAPQNLQVTLLNTGMDVPGFGNNTTRPSADGRFRISNVSPGQYKLLARGTVPSPQPVERGRTPTPRAEPARLWAAADISMDGSNVSNVMLVLQPGMTVSGQIAFEGARARPTDLTRVRVNLAPTAMTGAGREAASAAAGRVDASGRFTIPNVLPGTYRLTAQGATTGWFLESSMVGGQDALDFPFEVKPNQNITGLVVTFGDQQTELSGTLLDDRNAPATDYTIVIFPAEEKYRVPNSRRIRTARPATDGGFTIRTLPPGEYRLATVIDPEPGAWTDPDYLSQLDTASMTIRLGPGEKKVQNVRLR
jgi:protocatechuate 3,4-dioxygenase beta subunit